MFCPGIQIVSATARIVTPWLSPSSIADMSIALFEIEFASDLYVNGVALSDFSLNSIYWDAQGNLYPGEITWALAGSAALSCTGFNWWLMGESTDINDAPLFILPAVENPLGLIYGWQYNPTETWPSNKLVIALPLTVLLFVCFLPCLWYSGYL